MKTDDGRSGGCQCGAVRIDLRGGPERVYCCHCTECQRQSASAFGISAIYPPGALTVTRGTPKRWTRPTQSGGQMHCHFCPDCGSRLWHEGGRFISVKGGALDEPPEPQSHIWVSRKLPWVILPDGMPAWDNEPSD